MIHKRRIQNVDKYMLGIEEGATFYVGLKSIDGKEDRLLTAGFSNNLEVGETVLPSIIRGVTRFNSEGKFEKRRDLPKETYYLQRDWNWKDWGGNEHSTIVDVQRERFQREFIPPPSIELTLSVDSSNEKIVISPLLEYTVSNKELIKHVINLFLELFGECQLYSKELVPAMVKLKKLNWNILPQGRYPWDKLINHLEPIFSRTKKGNQPVIKYRFETINKRNPEFIAIGEAGFQGYVVFGFPKKNIYILESQQLDNATYIFEDNWENLSQYTKADIIANNLHKDRIIHIKGWEDKIDSYL